MACRFHDHSCELGAQTCKEYAFIFSFMVFMIYHLFRTHSSYRLQCVPLFFFMHSYFTYTSYMQALTSSLRGKCSLYSLFQATLICLTLVDMGYHSLDISSSSVHTKRRIWQESISVLFLTSPECKIPDDQPVQYAQARDGEYPPYLLDFKGSPAERHVENLKVGCVARSLFISDLPMRSGDLSHRFFVKLGQCHMQRVLQRFRPARWMTSIDLKRKSKGIMLDQTVIGTIRRNPTERARRDLEMRGGFRFLQRWCVFDVGW